MKLRKIKLINWHIFNNQTIEINGNTVFTGENGCGKSTLLDAIYFVLSGGDDRNFNKAASEKSKRTLETYLKGKTGTEGNEYLRNQSDIVGYILLDFYSNKINNNIVIGSELEINNSNKVRFHFFALENYLIDDDDFIVNKIPLDYSSLKKKFKSNNIILDELGDTKKEIRTKIKNIFKLKDSSKYFELLKKALSFKNIDEVSTFVTDFLLEDSALNLDNLIEELRSYQDIHKQLIKEEEKVKLLEKSIDNANRYVDNLDKNKYLNILNIECELDKINNNLNRNNIELKKCNETIIKYEDIIKNYTEELDSKKKEIYELENDEAFKVLKDKKEKLKQIEKVLNEIIIKNTDFENKVISEQKIIDSLNLKYRLNTDVKNKDIGLLKAHFENYKEDLDKLTLKNNEQKAKLNLHLENLKENLNNKTVELNTLRKGLNNYPKDVNNLIEIAKEAILKNFEEKDPDVRPLCEHIEILDDNWTNAIEGYLNTQRFYLVFNPKYYDVVSEAFSTYKNERQIYNTGIVNIGGIIKYNEDLLEKESLKENSLSTKIQVDNIYAKSYTDYLLGNVICCDNVKDLKKYNVSITKEVMINKNYVLRACNPNIYKIPYIGRSSREKRIKILEEDINNINKEISLLNNNINDINNQIKTINTSKVDQLLETEIYWNKIEILEKNVKELVLEIKENESSEGLLAKSERLNQANKKITEIKNNIAENEKIKNDNYSKKGSIGSKIEELNCNKFNSERNYDELIKQYGNDNYQEKRKDYLLNDKINSELVIKELDECIRSNNAMKPGIESTINEYSNKYNSNLIPTIDNIKDYINEYNIIKNRGIVDFKYHAENAYRKAQSSFREDFISKLKEKIDNAKKCIKEINNNLKTHPFGIDEEIYEFTYEGNKADFGEYYRIINSGKLQQAKDLFSEVLDAKDNDTMNELFNIISMETDSNEAEEKLQRYLDYKNYMSYDIKITNKRGEISYYSKINKEKSGGETQTPFYIAMASCFDSLKDKDQDVTNVVIFDEAFNNMDENRISSLMEFYVNLKIQILIIVPPSRINSIGKHMDTMIGISKKDNVPRIVSILGDSNG